MHWNFLNESTFMISYSIFNLSSKKINHQASRFKSYHTLNEANHIRKKEKNILSIGASIFKKLGSGDNCSSQEFDISQSS